MEKISCSNGQLRVIQLRKLSSRAERDIRMNREGCLGKLRILPVWAENIIHTSGEYICQVSSLSCVKLVT